MDNSMTKTRITFKVVSTLKRLEVKDIANVDERKDVKKMTKLLGAANGGGSNITNTYSTKIRGYSANTENCDKAVLNSRIDVVAGIIKWLDNQDSQQLRSSVEKFHKTVASEKKKLSDEYGSTKIPAERYVQYLNACRAVSVSVWVTQLVVTKISPTPFEGGILNSESQLYHATVKTKTVYTSYPITKDYLISQNAVTVTEEVEDYVDDNGVEQTRTVQICDFIEAGTAALTSFKKRASGNVEIAHVVNKKTGEEVLTLRRVTT